MGQKVNFNSKNKNLKMLKRIAIVVLILFTLFILYKSIRDVRKDLANERQQVNNNYSNQDNTTNYNSLDEALEKYNAKFIRREDTKDLVKIYLQFNYDLYTGKTSNESYFVNISKMLANFLNYKNFELIDETRKIDIEVFCENPNISAIIINGEENYYLNHNSEINKKIETVEETRFTIQSKELQSLIDGNWDETKVDWGTKDSTCDKYQIFFDEGIKYKIVARNVFNVVFTSNYSGQVAGGLTPSSSPEAIISALGEPTLLKEEYLYGYLGENSYLFFDFINNEISVYPIVRVEDSEAEQLKDFIKKLDETKDVKAFATSLTGLWLDYDYYDYDSNYVDLRYTLKGIRLNISGSSLQNGIFVYQNYSGDRDILELDNVYMESEDFVVEEELNRAMMEGVCHTFEGEAESEELSEEAKRLGELFVVYFSKDGNTGPRFYSINGEYPDSELDRNLSISSFGWYDAYNFIYSIDNDGIYVYNAAIRENTKLLDLNQKIEINSIEVGRVIYNDNEVLEIYSN